jgi:hypothetical protein
MFSVRLLWHWLWFAQTGLNVILLVVLVVRRSYRNFPIFVSYVSWRALESGMLLWMNYSSSVSGNQYAIVFAAGRAIDAGLALAMVAEIFKQMMGPYPALRRSGIAVFRWVTIALLMLDVALAWLAPATGDGHVMSGFYILDRTVNTLLCGLLVLLFVFPRLVGLFWRSQAFGIALGLGILAAASLATSAIRSQVEPIARTKLVDIMDVVTHATYLSSILIWITYLLAPQRAWPTIVSRPPDHNLETWNEELRRLLRR